MLASGYQIGKSNLWPPNFLACRCHFSWSCYSHRDQHKPSTAVNLKTQ